MRAIRALSLMLLVSACTAAVTHGYHVTKTTPLPGNGSWDYLTVDEAARRVYIAHSTQVDVLDADSGSPVGEIIGLQGVHGVAIAPESGHGFITNGKSDMVTIFDLKTLAPTGKVKTGKKPDAIAYEPATQRVLAFNGESNSATVIDAVRGKKIGTIALKGAPEFAVADGSGHVFVNLEDKSELLELDAKKLKVLQRWTVAPGESPSSLAIDRQNRRLFIGCRNKLLVVVDSASGKNIASLPLGDHVDATMFDPQTKEVINSNGDGTLTVIKQDDADHYHVAETVSTAKGSKTFAIDGKTHTLFVPAADFSPVPAPTAENPKPRPTAVAGTFKVLIFEK